MRASMPIRIKVLITLLAYCCMICLPSHWYILNELPFYPIIETLFNCVLRYGFEYGISYILCKILLIALYLDLSQNSCVYNGHVIFMLQVYGYVCGLSVETSFYALLICLASSAFDLLTIPLIFYYK